MPSRTSPRSGSVWRGSSLRSCIRNPFESNSFDFAALLQGLSRFRQDDQVATRAALEIEAEIDPDLLMVYLPGIDRVSRSLWAAEVPQESLPEALRLPAIEVERNRESLRDYYRFVDALLGRLLERYGLEDLVLVVSDHGFEAARRHAGHPRVEECAGRDSLRAGAGYRGGQHGGGGRNARRPADAARLVRAAVGGKHAGARGAGRGRWSRRERTWSRWPATTRSRSSAWAA